ncbi:MAG: hypothetical protein WCH11_04515, partial [Bdellovibrio sp.]
MGLMGHMGLSQQEWLVKSSGIISGPYSLEELVERLRNRQISVIDEVKGPMGRWIFVREQSLLKDIVAKIREEDLDLYEKTGAVGGDASRTVTVETMLPSENASVSAGRSPNVASHRRLLSSASSEGQTLDFGADDWKIGQGKSRAEVGGSSEKRYWSSLLLAFGFVIALVLGISVLMKSRFQHSPGSLSVEQSWAAVLDQIRLGQYNEAWQIARVPVSSLQLNDEQRKTLVPVALVSGHVREAQQLLESLP